VSSDQLLFHLQYKDQTPLSTDDEKQVELVLETWERYVQACCRLVLAEVAWQMEPVIHSAETFGVQMLPAVEEDLEAATSNALDISSVGLRQQSPVDTPAKVANEAEKPTESSTSSLPASGESLANATSPEQWLTPSSTTTRTLTITFIEGMQEFIDRMNAMNLEQARYLASTGTPTGEALRRLRNS
jgi:hypothetical protein